MAEILDTTKTVVHIICADYNLRLGHVYNVIIKAHIYCCTSKYSQFNYRWLRQVTYSKVITYDVTNITNQKNKNSYVYLVELPSYAWGKGIHFG